MAYEEISLTSFKTLQTVESTNTLRFQVEDVDEVPQQSFTAEPTSPSGQHTITSSYQTSDAIPNTVYYRDQEEGKGKSRPSLDALRQGEIIRSVQQDEENVTEESRTDSARKQTKQKWWQFWVRSKEKKPPKKLGWIMGVLVRCLLNIWGVMLFIRLSWVVGQAGIGLASVIILLSTVVTIVTTLSMSAICTNGEVKGGGAYYLISRSLGPEFGGAIGVIFSLANAVAVGLYVVGFTETVTELLVRNNSTIPGLDEINHIRIFGFVTALLLLGIALVGLDWESKIQIVLLIILLVALANAVIGSFIPRGCDDIATLQGFTHYRIETFAENFVPQFQPKEDFFSIFSVFFPAATGILAGANISGDLKNPQTAIPKGTLLAIIISSSVYLGIAWLLGFTVIRFAPGSPTHYFGSITEQFMCSSGEFLNGSLLQYCSSSFFNMSTLNTFNDSCSNCLNITCSYGNSTTDLKDLCTQNNNCAYGSIPYFQIMEMISGYGPIVTAGIFAATLSSALASLVSAPKVFQRVCQDKIFPFIEFFGKGGWKGTGNEPIRGYFLTFFIAIACIAIGELNVIALIISNFFLMAYTLINFSCFAASFSKSPGWRPAFRFYSQWVSLLGAAMCLAIMFVISWWAALITLVAVGALYLIVYWRKPDINWGSSTQAFLYSYAMKNLLKLEKLEDHVKNFRPQFLLLTGAPSSRPDMTYFFSQIAIDSGMMVCGQVLLGDYTTNRRVLLSTQQRKWLRSKKIKAFHNIVSASSLRDGVQSLLQLSGLGKIRPNTLVIGFKSIWQTSSQESIEEYVNILHDAFDLQFGVVIFRLRAGFDATDLESAAIQPVELKDSTDNRPADDSPPLVSDPKRGSSTMPLLPSASTSTSTVDPYAHQGLVEVPLQFHLNDDGDELNTSAYTYQKIDYEDMEERHSLNSYNLAMQEGIPIDPLDEPHRAIVTPLPPDIPEIVSMPSRFEKKQESGFIDVWWLYDDGGLAILLPFLLSRNSLWKKCKLRIFVAGSSSNIDSARLRMTSLLRRFRISFSAVIEVSDMNKRPTKDSIDRYLSLPLDDIVNDESLDKKTLKLIRLGELLHDHSSDSKLIVVTIPVPQRGTSSRQYLSWLEIISFNLPPVLLMRGNQTSVLTFYS